MKRLYAQFNQIDNVPSAICGLTSLKEIWVRDDSKFGSFADSTLQLSHNRIDFLPTEFRRRLVHDEDLVSVWLLRGNQLDEEEMLAGVDMKLAAKGLRQCALAPPPLCLLTVTVL